MLNLQLVAFFKKDRGQMLKPTTHSPSALIQLPFTEYPTLRSPSFYYKTKQRVDKDRWVVLMGLKLHRMRRYEEDHLVFLMQVFNREVARVKIHLVEPCFMYGEVRMDILEQQEPNQEGLVLQRRLMGLLAETQKQLGQFLDKTMNQGYILKSFHEEQFLKQFSNKVIIRVKEKQAELFGGEDFKKT